MWMCVCGGGDMFVWLSSGERVTNFFNLERFVSRTKRNHSPAD